MAAETTDTGNRLNELASTLVDQVIKLGLEGKGPLKGSEDVAREHLASADDVEAAIERLIRTHTRNVAVTGFASGFGGIVVAGVHHSC